MKYRWGFCHRLGVKYFGPYETEDEAKEAFQRQYGYWPEDAISKVEYNSSERG